MFASFVLTFSETLVMSNTVSLQADVAGIPSNSLAVLGTLNPLLKALSSDNVNPLAVLQAEALGTRFQINGELAARVPDLLVRSSSIRLERLSKWVGWLAGDTASAMSHTAGGRAASLLSLSLVELYGQSEAGLLLHQLSSRILPLDQTHSSEVQLGQVAAILSKKLAPLAFGTHLARHVTQIRETYFNSGLDIPRGLLDKLTVETMTELLSALHTALHEETSSLYVEGFQGLGMIVAVVMALCPHDALVTIEDEIVYASERRSVVISIKSGAQTKFGVETILRNTNLRSDIVASIDSGRNMPFNLWPYHLSMKPEGCLSDAVDLLLVSVAANSSHELRFSIVELITAVVFSISGNELYTKQTSPEESLLPCDGFKPLLGPDIMKRVRNKLALLFGAEPSMRSFDCVAAYHNFRVIVNNVIPSVACTCGQCLSSHIWLKERACQSHCIVSKFWDDLDQIIGNAIILLFVEYGKNTCASVGWITNIGFPIRLAIMRRVFQLDSDKRRLLDEMGTDYTTTSLHYDILKRVTPNVFTNDMLGVSSGSISIFPSTIDNPVLSSQQCLTYVVAEGQFHDHRNYYTNLVCDEAPSRSIAQKPVKTLIGPSTLGAHSSLTLTMRPHYNNLSIRTMVQVSSTIIQLDFLRLHLAYIGLSFAAPCAHDPRVQVDKDNVTDIFLTSVASPAAEEKYLSIVLTHGNPEAQFLCGVPGIRTLFQANSCLNCAMKEARERGFRILIQS